MHPKTVCTNNSIYYKGELQKCEDIIFSRQQTLLLDRALHGLDAYSNSQLSKMHREKKVRITRVSDKAFNIIEGYKLKKVKSLYDSFITKFFPKSKFTTSNIPDEEYDEELKTNLSLNALDIKIEEIVILLIKERILPTNFYTL